jgi:hypothetical protein
MLSKEELKARKLEFWNTFRLRMSKIRSSNGRKMNWLSYPTDVKNIYLRLDADKTSARLSFDIQHKDAGIRAIIWEQMYELKKVLVDAMDEEGDWIEHCYSDSVPDFCRIEWKLEGVNFYNDADTEKIYAFFQEKLIKFDDFYQQFKDILVLLIK